MTPRPLRLRPDNFTPATRTPWGGHRIAGRYKAGLEPAVDPERRVGEAWELSVGPEFPSFVETGDSLADALARDPDAMLGAEAATGTALLVKWLDADDELSVQIHPPEGHPSLAPDETGKPEAWYVVAREPGAGLYLGFEPGTRADEVRDLVGAGGNLAGRMRFVPVEPGDVFVIEPGIPHAIGRGVTLIEPQRVAHGKRGVTYRYWDWNRRYDAGGQPDLKGQPRTLHLNEALAVTDWQRACDPGLLERVRGRFGPADPTGEAECRPLAGPEQGLHPHSRWLRVARLQGTGESALAPWNVLRSVTVIEGSVQIGRGDDGLALPAGCTAAVPAALAASPVVLSGAHAVVCACA